MADGDDDLRPLLVYLRGARGFDFTGYRPSSLRRRIRRRMAAVGIDDYDAYRDHLEVEPAEFSALFDTILINVTGFFRDPDAWDVVRSSVVPAILEARGDEAAIRVWSAGCASGEEAYSAAMVFAEALGEADFQRRVKIYGTDVDDGALEQARRGTYDADSLEAVPDALVARYFERAGHRWAFRKDLRRPIVFGRNNLVEDAPISRIDLLLCRNTLMYFNSEVQGRILRRMHFALQETGFVFLGKSEMFPTRSELFEPLDLRRRIFTKVSRPGDRRSRPLPAPGGDAPSPRAGGSVPARALDAAGVPLIVVAGDRTLLLASDAARRMFSIAGSDVGRPFQDLEVSYRPAELRGAVETAFHEQRAVDIGPVTHRHGDEELHLAIRVSGLPSPGDRSTDAVAVTFTDVTARRYAEEEAERARAELGAAYEQLQSTVEELETTNEELQSTNEELETTNEELQSTNEELETMNEELQSANEELAAMNDEMRVRSLELRESNAVMEAILAAKGVGVFVVDRDERIRLWSAQSEDLWGVRADEVAGAHLRGLDIGLPVEPLVPVLDEVLFDGTGQRAIEVRARDRRGREFPCRLTAVPLSPDGGRVAAAIVIAERRQD